MIRIRGVLSFLLFFAGILFSQTPTGTVVTVDESGNISPVSGAEIRITGTNFTTNSDDNGKYTFEGIITEAKIDFYILKATKTGLIPTYTIPTPAPLVSEMNQLNTIIMLPDNSNYNPQPEKSHLIVFTVNPGGELISGAEARVYDKNNSLVSNSSNTKYIKLNFEGDTPTKIEIVNDPGDDTYGYIVYNLPPSIYFVSASKSGLTFNTRPAFTFANSITTGIDIDGVWQASGTKNFTGKCVDIEENVGPVSGATVTFIGLPGFSATSTSEDGTFTINALPYPSIGVLKASKNGYKNTCYPFLISEDTESETIMMVKNKTFDKVKNDLGITIDANRGNFVGGIFDYYGNSIRNIQIKGADETGNESTLTVYYMDSNGEKFDKNLTKTTDDSTFLTPNIEVDKPVYTKFALGDNDIYYGFIFSFPDSIFLSMFDFENIKKGNLELENPGQGSPQVVGGNDQNVLALKFNLRENTGYENVNLELDTIVITDIATGDMGKISEAKLVLDNNKNGQFDEGEESVSVTNPQDRKIVFHPGWTVYAGSSINLLVLYSFQNATGGDEYKATIQNNSDITAWGVNSLLEVSVDGAPVEGGKITILTEGVPDISVDPINYNFGEVKVGEESDVLTINVMNAGTENLVIDGSIQVSGDTSDFVILEDSVSNATITTGNTKTILVKFKPRSNGVKQIKIKINSNDLDENPVEITLTGTGYGAPVSGGGGGGGCFIATACFGNYNHPFVRILREFRDRILLKNSIGKKFVKWYYAHSPKYAQIIRNNLILKILTQILLIPVVFIAYLIVKGFLPVLLLALTFCFIYKKLEKILKNKKNLTE